MASESVVPCNRGACDASAHPCGYHRVTHGLYCLGCARRIEKNRERFNPDWVPFFPLLPRADDVTDGGSWERGLIVVREVADGE